LAIWQVAVLGLAVWLAFEITGTSQAIWSLAQLQLAAFASQPPGVSATVTAAAGPTAADCATLGPPTADAEPGLPLATFLGAEPAVTTAVPAATSPATWPGLVWLLGALVVVLWVAWRRLLLARFVRQQADCVDLAVVRRVRHLATSLGIRRDVRLLQADELAAPVAFGVWRPAVALPATFAGDFAPRQQEAILAHELAHLAAFDPAWQFFADLVCAALWWHPAAWWARHRLHATSETAADEASLLVPEGPSLLADCLVALGRRMHRSGRLVWLSAEGSGYRSALGRRVERLLNHQQWTDRRPTESRVAVARAALPAGLIVVAVLGTAWARPQALLTEGESMAGVLKTSWRSSLGAVALAALLSPGVGNARPDEGPSRPKEKPPVARDAAPPADAEKPVPPPAERERGRNAERRGRPEGVEGPRGPQRPDAEALRQRMQEIRERVERLREEGKTDEVERLKEEARQLMRRGDALREGFRGRGGPGFEGRPEMTEPLRRMIHLRMAMDNLRAAGLTEMADKVRDQLEALQREHPQMKMPEGNRLEGRPWQRFSREPGPQAASEGPGRQPTGTPELQELREQMQRMHREVQELREQMRQRGERRE
jgi:beta-lactamase regulating signal transducer with metallopeptidase domain